jgi:hypothetical protein
LIIVIKDYFIQNLFIMPRKMKYPVGLGTIQITIPAATAGDIKSLENTLERIAEQLGCPNCVSGYNCRFQLEKDYLFDPIAQQLSATDKGEIAEITAPTIRVNVGPKASYTINSLRDALRKIADLSGHTACATGCNIYLERFRHELYNLNNSGRVTQLKFTANV